jgi:hypothetical protein
MDATCSGRHAVDRHGGHALRNTGGILDVDLIDARPVTVLDGETRPRRGNARIEEERVTALLGKSLNATR